MQHELPYTTLNQPLTCRKEVPLPYRPTSWSDWQMNLLARSGVLVAIQRIGSMKNHQASLGYEILDGLSYPPLWSAYLNRRKSCGVFQEKGGFRGRRGWQAWDSPVWANKSRDIIRVEFVAFSWCICESSRAVATTASTETCMRHFWSGTGSGIQHAPPFKKDVVQIAWHLKHVSSSGKTLFFYNFNYLPINHSNENLFSKTAQAFILTVWLQQHKQRIFLEGSWVLVGFFLAIFTHFSQLETSAK